MEHREKTHTSFKWAIKTPNRKEEKLNWPNFCDAIFERKKNPTKYTIITVIFHIK